MTENVYTALLAFQADAPELQRTGINPHFQSKYVPLEHVMAEVMPILNQHGLTWATRPTIRDGEPALFYELMHAASQTIIADTMLLCSKGGKPQDQGSAITYARRYAMMAVLGLTANDDDDGRRASRPARSRARKTPKATLDALVVAAKGLRGAQIKMAFGSAGVAYPTEGGIFDSVSSTDAEKLIRELEAAPR